jgi:hypothetical protein
MNPKVKHIIPHDNFTMEIEFSNGEIKLFDFKPYFNYPIYELLQDKSFFLQARIFNGTVIWNESIDFCPDRLYLESKKRNNVI